MQQCLGVLGPLLALIDYLGGMESEVLKLMHSRVVLLSHQGYTWRCCEGRSKQYWGSKLEPPT